MKALGVTGTRQGITGEQLEALYAWFHRHASLGYTDLHHGDCVGADATVASRLGSFGLRLVSHPPSERSKWRAWVISQEYRMGTSYEKRNQAIVDECDLLLVFPKSRTLAGGTKMTHDFAVKANRPMVIFWPNGSVERKEYL